MGSNVSKSTSADSIRNYSTILRNGKVFKLGDLDVSERHLLMELRRTILVDELLDVIGQDLSRYKIYQGIKIFCLQLQILLQISLCTLLSYRRNF